MGKVDKLREIELELLEHFIRICERENLKWYASHGTLLGAVRDGGFLLWDDDIDVVMPTEDFNRLMAHKEWFDNSYYLQTPLDNRSSHVMRLYKNGTTAFDRPLYELLKKGGHHGISIDILPLDEIEDTGFYHLRDTTIPIKHYEPCKKAKFEHLEVNVPARARKVLDLLYGYWAWPSGAEFPKPHNWFFDTETDYSVYVKRYTGWLKDSEGKKIFLFGAADSLRIWLRDFKRRHQVLCTFDNDASKWGAEAFGIEIRNPAEIPDLLDDESILLIVSIWHQEIGRQLEDMGIIDYYVFFYELLKSEFRGSQNAKQSARQSYYGRTMPQ